MRRPLPSSAIARWSCSLVLSTLAASLPAWAQTPPEKLADLQRQTVERAQQEMAARGYTLASSDAGPQRSWQYWWQRRDNACAQLVIVGGRIESVAATIETDCDQTRLVPWKQSRAGRTAMAAARAAGVDTLLHKSHERDVRRYNDVNAIAEFERGYRDAQPEQAARDAGRTGAYADGFQAGQRKRAAPWSARPGLPLPPQAGGAPPPLASLVGARDTWLEPTMQAHRFQHHTGFTKNGETFNSWLRLSDRLCIQTVSVGGIVRSVGEPSEQGCI
jgi:hypothetical protein